MTPDTRIASVAALVGDPARTAILLALMDGRARTAKELAFLARVAAPTASGHLAKLLEADLVAVAPQGRHRYYRLASPLVARMVEALGAVAGEGPVPRRVRAPADTALRAARTCYDHLAGRLGVALADALQAEGHIVLEDGGGAVTPSGRDFFARFGLDPEGEATGRRRLFCRPCLDWTERRDHLAGVLGARLCTHCFQRGWVERTRDSRALTVTPAGRAGFAEWFGIALDADGAHLPPLRGGSPAPAWYVPSPACGRGLG